MKTLQKIVRSALRIILPISICLCSATTGIAQNSIDKFMQLDSLESVDKIQEAEHLLIQLSKENPYHVGYFYSLGEIYHEKEEYKKSISALKKAQELGWIYRSNYYLASNYTNLGKYDSALFYLSQHLITPMNGDHPFEDDVLMDSIFLKLRPMSGYKSLLPPQSSDTNSRNENWITDINYLSDMLKKTHFDPFIQLSEAKWDLVISALISEIPELNDDQIYVRIAQFVAMIGDGHTRILNSSFNKSRFKKLPIATRLFSDGCYIVAASEGYENLLGAKIVKVENMEFDEVYKKVCSVIPIDNEMDYRFLFDWEFRKMNILHGLGICNSIDEIVIEYTQNGKLSSSKILSAKENNFPELISYHDHYKKEYPIFLENHRKASEKLYWFKYLEEVQIMYVQVNVIASMENEPLPGFCDSIKEIVETEGISAFIFDLRNNGGGNTELNKHYLALLLSDNINIRGKLFTVIGPNTFSAAQNLSNILENYTETIFIGEPSGSKPHFIGEVNPVKLPCTGILVSSSNIFHQHGYSTDTRTWIAPDIYVDLCFEDYINGRDPVLEEIKDYLK